MAASRSCVAAIKADRRSAGVLFPCNYGRCIDSSTRVMISGDDYSSVGPIVSDHRVCTARACTTEWRKLRAGRSLSELNVLYCIVPSFRRFIRTIRHVIRRSRGCTKKATATVPVSHPRRRNSRRTRRQEGEGEKFIRALTRRRTR